MPKQHTKASRRKTKPVARKGGNRAPKATCSTGRAYWANILIAMYSSKRVGRADPLRQEYRALPPTSGLILRTRSRIFVRCVDLRRDDTMKLCLVDKI